MNQPQDDFQNLRRLIALKRYEQPPPRYFNGFSSEVIVRIRAGERIDQFSIWEAFSWEAPWLQKLWHAVETRPVLAGSFGVAICGFLMAGMLYSEPNSTVTFSNVASVPNNSVAPFEAQTAVPMNPLVHPVGATTSLPGVQGLSPGPESDSLFQQFRNTQAGRVDFISTSPR